VPTVLKSGSLKLLDASGPVQASNGVAFFLCIYKQNSEVLLLFFFVRGEIEKFICRGAIFVTLICTGVSLICTGVALICTGVALICTGVALSSCRALLVLPSHVATHLLHNIITLPLQFPLISQGLLVLPSSLNTLRTRSFKLFKRPLPGFLTILTL